MFLIEKSHDRSISLWIVRPVIKNDIHACTIYRLVNIGNGKQRFLGLFHESHISRNSLQADQIYDRDTFIYLPYIQAYKLQYVSL